MIIRRAAPDDAAAIHAIYAPYVETTPISLEVTPPTVEEMALRMEGEGGLYPWIVGEEEERVIAYAYAGRFRVRAAYRFAAETSIYVDEAAHGRGIGRALYGALFDIMRLQGFTEAVASITLPNDASVAIHERFGFARVGVFPRVGWKLGRRWDVGFWQAPLAAASGDLVELVPWRDIRLPAHPHRA